MSFMDDVKRSLGYEETETSDNKESALSNISKMFNNLTQSSNKNKQKKLHLKTKEAPSQEGALFVLLWIL